MVTTLNVVSTTKCMQLLESLCCTPERNIMYQLYFNVKKGNIRIIINNNKKCHKRQKEKRKQRVGEPSQMEGD